MHHVSRHLTDRQNDRAVAWNSIGIAASRQLSGGANDVSARLDLARIETGVHVKGVRGDLAIERCQWRVGNVDQ